MDQIATTTPPNCPQCGKPIAGTPVPMKVIGRGYNPTTRKQFVETRSLEFCSTQCGVHHQMSLEG